MTQFFLNIYVTEISGRFVLWKFENFFLINIIVRSVFVCFCCFCIIFMSSYNFCTFVVNKSKGCFYFSQITEKQFHQDNKKKKKFNATWTSIFLKHSSMKIVIFTIWFFFCSDLLEHCEVLIWYLRSNVHIFWIYRQKICFSSFDFIDALDPETEFRLKQNTTNLTINQTPKSHPLWTDVLKLN